VFCLIAIYVPFFDSADKCIILFYYDGRQLSHQIQAMPLAGSQLRVTAQKIYPVSGMKCLSSSGLFRVA